MIGFLFIFYRFFLVIAVAQSCAIMALADTWDNYLTVANIVQKSGKITGMPEGVEKQKEIQEHIPGLPSGARAHIEQLVLTIEPDSIELYRRAKPGAPFIGIVNLITGTIYLHPTVLTYQLSVVEDDTSFLYDSTDIFQIEGDFFAQLPVSWQQKYSIGNRVILTPQKYTAKQLPQKLYKKMNYFESLNFNFMNSKEALSSFGNYSIISLATHKGREQDRYKKFVYHSRNDAFVLPEERKLIYDACHPNNPNLISSHECLVDMLEENDVPHLGFAITKIDKNFCQSSPEDRIGDLNGLYFTGTSASQNNGIYVIKNGAMAEREARKIYTALTTQLGIEADHIGPCPGTFKIKKNLPAQAKLSSEKPLKLDFVVEALGQSQDSSMELGYDCIWYKNGKILSEVKTCSFSINEYLDSSQGTYQVFAVPKLGGETLISQECTVTLAPLPGPPRFTQSPQSIFYAKPGQNINIIFAMKNASHIKWEKYRESSNSWSGRGTSESLEISGFDQKYDAGRYRIIGSNTSGSLVHEFQILPLDE